MNFADLSANLLSPPILCFLLGILAALLRSDLELPAPVPKALSLFLLFALGFKGGLSLAQSSLGTDVIATLLASMLAAIIVPFWTFMILRTRLGPINAAAVAATYGSISAVTFITASAFLVQKNIVSSGHMVAAMALMESPAIIVGVLLARRYGAGPETSARIKWSALVRDAFLNGSVFLLLGSLLIGLACGPARGAQMKPFIDTLFPGLLALFLLDLGLIAGRRLGQLRALGTVPVVFALLAPLVNASIGFGLAWMLHLSQGDAFLLVVLCASSSYIAVPAALRVALPEANPGIYVTLSLALTFPFNLLIGLPLYHHIITALLPH